tara:strand:- start:225 stop:1517 length:1293 start_codon:yes stop_codon:yes gene_type:complete
MDKQSIAIIGLGYVGLPLAVEFAKHKSVIGYDTDNNRIKELKDGIDKTYEIDSNTLKDATRLRFSSDLESIGDCNVYIVTVPTPIDNVNRPNLDPLKKATKSLGTIIKKKDIIIYESTVYPGCTEEVCVPILEDKSGLKYNEDFFCGYSPERINPGDKINTISKIKKVTSGSNPKTAEFIDNLYGEIIEAGTFKAKSIKVAEAAKVIENTQRDLNIALINELSVIFGRLDIDTIDVIEAASSKWNFIRFMPGLVGGHCIGVDPYYLTYKAEQVNYNPQVILAGRRINDNMAIYFVKKFVQKMINNGLDIATSKVAVLGVTFKENCPDIRNSKIIDLIKELKNWGLDVCIVDPWANEEELKRNHGIELNRIEDICGVDSIISAVGHKQFRDLSADELKDLCKSGISPIMGDVKSIHNKEDLENIGFTVFRL